MWSDHPNTEEERPRPLCLHNHIHCGDNFRRCVMINELIPRWIDGRANVEVPAATAFPTVTMVGRIPGDCTNTYARVCAVGSILTPTQRLVEVKWMAGMVELGVSKCCVPVLFEPLWEARMEGKLLPKIVDEI
eukprot:COSAG02_NODE_15511_length_1164_cov_1.215962_1_plen_133_part_00